jgi:hypothetical protein
VVFGEADQFHFENVALAAQCRQSNGFRWSLKSRVVTRFDALGFMSSNQEASTSACHKPASTHTFLDHAEIARHFFRFLDQGSQTSPDAFSPERFVPWVEIKRSE